MVSKYIDNKELKRVIEDGKLKPFRIRKILKDQGIILASNNPEQIAKQVYPILWGSYDIENLSQSLDDESNYIKSSVVEVEIKKSDNIIDELEDFFYNASFGMTRYRLSAVNRVDDDQLVVKLRYTINRPGRNEFISTQHKNTDIIVRKVSDEKAIIDVRQASTTEMKEINKFLEEATKKDTAVHTHHITLRVLTNENKIAFFDEFIKKNFADWRFETVTKVELKRCEGSEDDETRALDEEESSALSNLQGITSAILNGTSIRNNSFVQECLQNNFYITTMGYKFESLSDLRKVVVEVNFKYDDLKIDICKTYEYDSDSEGLRLHPAMLDIQEEILKMFQEAAYEQYIEIFERQKQNAQKAGVN
ncbi:hypothetical protein [Megasphaera stantonii]|uniref:Uncharacterized protein n=1 Tax=Megasphaera stantonii TaxID=2144175 RepID=A0A346B281_9FIRM|nr:hypothetical protein [Megasphaera stantonii]AXL22224.1 hypothetical protein DKB62_11985 [Megasphaera stantonii]